MSQSDFQSFCLAPRYLKKNEEEFLEVKFDQESNFSSIFVRKPIGRKSLQFSLRKICLKKSK